MKKTTGIMLLLCAALLTGCGQGDSAQSAASTGVGETSAKQESQTQQTTASESSKTAEGSKEADASKASEESKETTGKEAQSTEAQQTSSAAGTTAQAAEPETPAATEAPALATHGGYVFQAGAATIGMNEDSAPGLAAMGQWNDYFESESCAFQGLDKTYTYPGFELYTYPMGSKDMVNSINFLDGTVSTPEGIHIGSAEADIAAAYGDGYVLENGVYQYTKDKSILSIFVTDGVVDGVEYTAITE